MAQVLLCGALILTLSMGIRHGFGLWLQPVTMERGWSREAFALAIAIQNLGWGVAAPLAGVFADRFGAFRVLLVGSVLYAAGLAGMATATSSLGFALSAGVMIGVAQAGTTYAVIYGVIGRNVAPEKRSRAMGIGAAAGSFGQFLMVPVENVVMAGYFVCGFQVVFIGVHLPSYLKDHGLSPSVATTALALVGLFNVIGTYTAGELGQRFPRRYILSAIYALRSVCIALFLLAPLTPWSVYIFASAMGVLWLSTVPPTNAVIAQIFGVQYMSMLSGFVFLSHQVGSFLGAWMGGWLYGLQGNYNVVWGICIALGVFAALINLPVKEAPIVRTAPQAA